MKRTNADGTYTEYIGGIFEKTFSAAGTATGTTKYYSAVGRTIAVRQTPVGGTMTLTYLLADHLGTTVGTIDAATGAITNAKYWPYGAPRSGAIAQTDKLYTGQQQELGDALGLYFYHARFYSTTTGQFVSADSATSDGLNRYSYTRNNPLRYDDPTGHGVTNDDGSSCPPTHPNCLNDGSGSIGGTGTGTCWDCYALQQLAESGASAANLIDAMNSTDPAGYLKQVYVDTGHGGSPGITQKVGDAINGYVKGRIREVGKELKDPNTLLNVAMILASRGESPGDIGPLEGPPPEGPVVNVLPDAGPLLAPGDVLPFEPDVPPGPGWERVGPNWYNNTTKESLHPDLQHADPVGPHYDYQRRGSNDQYRIFPDGRWELKQ